MAPKKDSLGKTLRDLRESKLLSLRTVEETTGISNAYLSQLENDKIKKPSANVLHKLANVYKVEFNFLLTKAGILESPIIPGKSFGHYVFSKENLTQEEEKELLQYLKFIRSRK